MADNYYDVTGVLRVKQVTPVIKALFSNFSLDPDYPGNGKAYIAVGYDHYLDWDVLQENLEPLEILYGIKVPEHEDRQEYFEATVEAFINHFGTQSHPTTQVIFSYLDQVNFDYNEPDIDFLFDLATVLNDGHGLEAYHVEGAWTCSKPRLGQFGGDATYRSHRLRVYSSSSAASAIGPLMDTALAEKDYIKAASAIAAETGKMLAGIVDINEREQVAQVVVYSLSKDYLPTPAAYENLIPTPIETTVANDEYQRYFDVAQRWAEKPHLSTIEACHGAVLSAYQLAHPLINKTDIVQGYSTVYDANMQDRIQSRSVKAAKELFGN